MHTAAGSIILVRRSFNPHKSSLIMKIILAAFAMLFTHHIQEQTYKFYQTDNIHNQLRLNTKTGEVYQIQDDGQRFLVCLEITLGGEKPGRYVLYKTKNMWTYILLDTFTGKLWQCQYSLDGDEYRFALEINRIELSTTETSKFSIQPLVSMYQFYLTNDNTGEMWKFQWSTKGAEYRWIEKF